MRTSWTLITLAGLLAASLILPSCSKSPKAAPSQVIQTPQGPVSGLSTEDENIIIFKGLPYAAPPIGDLRWRAPQPAPTWTQVKAADEFSDMCMQTIKPEDGFMDRIIDGHGLSAIKTRLIKRAIASQDVKPVSEDCLYLNVRADMSDA